ncbi:hypothetical protein RIF29_00291 [Crotalaria pallida]|uniref:Uncharacterized protein n=1 Tax=Crotalaria pallida TaxID=3830 RepID=A0AAN9IVI6_CROPI
MLMETTKNGRTRKDGDRSGERQRIQQRFTWPTCWMKQRGMACGRSVRSGVRYEIDLERKLDKTYMGEKKLFANMPKYNRDEMRKPKEMVRQGKGSRVPYATYRGARSYAQVTKGRANDLEERNEGMGKAKEGKVKETRVDEEWKGMKVSIDESEEEWLCNC